LAKPYGIISLLDGINHTPRSVCVSLVIKSVTGRLHQRSHLLQFFTDNFYGFKRAARSQQSLRNRYENSPRSSVLLLPDSIAGLLTNSFGDISPFAVAICGGYIDQLWLTSYAYRIS